MRHSARAGLLVVALAVAMIGLAGCGRLGNRSADPSASTETTETTELAWDAQALESIGFTQEEMGSAALAPAPSPTAEANEQGKRHPRYKRVRFAFRKGLQHGEAVVTTDEGTKTVVVQRGTVTAIDASSVTVKSADGFTLTWKFGSPLHVVEHRTQIQPSAIAVGTEVGVAGAKEGDSSVARLIVVPGAAK